ncbi:MAG TPA: hypothetical protein DEP84_24105 [Chloroflexi bacterium]|nr:hypothetical protein [Chloroflexota bacterium]
MDPDRLEFLAQVASWYYEENLSQEAIAQRIGRTRSMVSRLLQEAREQGLVEIRVHYPLKTDSELESRLRKTFGLSEVWVLAKPPAEHAVLLRRLGELGARCVQRYFHDGVRIGIGWGTAIHEVVRAMPALPLRDALVVQIIGAVGHVDPLVNGPELAHWLSEKLNATYRFLHAPLIVENDEVAKALLQERAIAETLDLARQVDVALVGIGTVVPFLSSQHRVGYLSEADLTMLTRVGAVGDILSRQLDSNGTVLDISLNYRVIGLDLETLRSIPTVIAVAGNVIKAPAVLAALRGGYVDVLITDANTASVVLTLNGDNNGVE